MLAGCSGLKWGYHNPPAMQKNACWASVVVSRARPKSAVQEKSPGFLPNRIEARRPYPASTKNTPDVTHPKRALLQGCCGFVVTAQAKWRNPQNPKKGRHTMPMVALIF